MSPTADAHTIGSSSGIRMQNQFVRELSTVTSKLPTAFMSDLIHQFIAEQAALAKSLQVALRS